MLGDVYGSFEIKEPNLCDGNCELDFLLFVLLASDNKSAIR